MSADEILPMLPEAVRTTIQVIPHVPLEGLVGAYIRHRLFVLPSITEGIPLSLLEAMACGLCPIVTGVGGVPDVVTDGANGILVPMLDPSALARAVARALALPDQTSRLARSAHAAMQSYGWARAAEQVEAFCASAPVGRPLIGAVPPRVPW